MNRPYLTKNCLERLGSVAFFVLSLCNRQIDQGKIHSVSAISSGKSTYIYNDKIAYSYYMQSSEYSAESNLRSRKGLPRSSMQFRMVILSVIYRDFSVTWYKSFCQKGHVLLAER